LGTALITGASAGIGLDLATCFAADKHDLVVVARRADRLNELAENLQAAHGIRVTVLTADLARPDVALEVFQKTEELGIQVDFLVNNAGLGTHGKFWELDPQREVDQIQVNVTSLVHLTRLYLPGMVARRQGRVLNIASTAGFQAGPFMATYFATKAFVVSFTEALAVELKGTGVTATAHCPGATLTEFAQVAGTENTRLFQRPGVATSQEVAVDAYRAMHKGQTVKVHGLINKLGVFGTRFAPRSLNAVVASMANAKK
jgi:short-subunit dehydrogenase